MVDELTLIRPSYLAVTSEGGVVEELVEESGFNPSTEIFVGELVDKSEVNTSRELLVEGLVGDEGVVRVSREKLVDESVVKTSREMLVERLVGDKVGVGGKEDVLVETVGMETFSNGVLVSSQFG